MDDLQDFQEKRRIRNFIYSPIVSLLLLVIVILLLKSNYNIYKTNQTAKMNREESDKRLALLRGQSERLSSELEKLNTERGIEDEIRNKFQVTKLGEEVLVVVDEVPPNQGKREGIGDENGGYWQKFRELLGF